MTLASLPSATAFDRVVNALHETVRTVKPTGPLQVTANCPAHNDNSPSLAVTGIEGSVLIHCHAGCDSDDILAALRLTRRDLYDTQRGATYTYTDLNGATTRQVHRSPEKKFRQTGQTKGTAQLYRLPQVTAAVARGDTIYLVEGEKDVHALETLGAVATTSPMGATNWPKVDPTPLTGAHVVIVPDRDQAGYRYATAAVVTLQAIGATIEIRLPKTGKDAADHIAAGHTLDELEPATLPDPPENPEPEFDHVRRVVLTSAADIKVRRIRWLWDGRIALGTLALLAGREGLGKSTLAYQLAADITRGILPGEDQGTPRSVLIAASEDSWEHTIVPRLIAAGADLRKVYRIEIVTHDQMHLGISLPKDYHDVEYAASQTDAGLMILDPLMSVIDSRLDTHRDREVREALEPLVSLAERTRMAILGLIHHNKSGSTDALQLVMGSKAFSAVARSVHTCIPDPDDETHTRKLFATSKNNLGRLDLPVLGFTITGHAVETEDDGTAWTGRLNWTGEVEGDMNEIMARTADPEKGATTEAASWLEGHLSDHGGEDDKKNIIKAGRAAGHSERTLQRAAQRLRVMFTSAGFPRASYWALPGATTPPAPSADTAPADQSPSRANPLGATAPVAPTLPGMDDQITSDAKSRQPLAPLGATRPDLQKHESEVPDGPRARTRTWGDTQVGATGEIEPPDTHESPVAPPRQAPPRTRATLPDLDIQAPACPECSWPVDTDQHTAICEEQP